MEQSMWRVLWKAVKDAGYMTLSCVATFMRWNNQNSSVGGEGASEAFPNQNRQWQLWTSKSRELNFLWSGASGRLYRLHLMSLYSCTFGKDRLVSMGY